MKILAFSFAEFRRCRANKTGRVLWFYSAFSAALAIVFFGFSFQLYRLSERTAFEQALNKSNLALDMAAESVASPINGLRHSLTLIARQPVLRKINSRGIIQTALKQSIKDFRLLTESFEFSLAEIFRIVFNYEDTSSYLKEIPAAAVRSFLALPAFFAGETIEASEDYLLLPESDKKQDYASKSRIAERLLSTLSETFASTLSILFPVAEIVESLIRAEKEALADQPAAENLLAVALVDDQIKGFVLKSLSGEVLAKVGDRVINTVLKDSRDCRAIQNGIPFYCGPVAYDRASNTTLWWVAVPVRNMLREPVACLTALIDVSFLSRLTVLLKSSHQIKTLFVDQSGILIGSDDKEMLGSRVDHNNQLPVIKGQAVVSRRIRRDSIAILQAGRSVKNDRIRYLPDWNVVSETSLQVFGSYGQKIIQVCVFLLAASGMYAISCCFVRTLKFLNGD